MTSAEYVVGRQMDPAASPKLSRAHRVRRAPRSLLAGRPVAAWRVCDDGCGWLADVTWIEQHEWGLGRYLKMMPPERMRLA